MVRRILALGDMDVVEEKVTHPPAEDRDLAHSAGQQDAMGTSHQGTCRCLMDLLLTPPPLSGLHTE